MEGIIAILQVKTLMLKESVLKKTRATQVKSVEIHFM